MIGIVGACLDRYEQATSSMLLSRSNGDQEGVEQSSHRHAADFKLVSAAVLAAACFLHCNRTMGDVNLLTRGYCADLQLPEGPERLKCYKKLCSIGRRKGSLEHTGKHARWFRCCVFVALVHRSISGFWKDQTLAPVHCRARPGPRVLCFLCQVCLEALGTPAREGALEQCRDPLSSGSGNSNFSWRVRFFDAAVGKPAASQSTPMFRLPSHPSRAGRAKPDSWRSGLAAPILQRIPFVEGSPGSCLFFPRPRPRPLPTLCPPTCTHLCLSSDLASYY